MIGEHIDYNGGSVLPTTIPLWTHVAVAARSDRTIRAVSASVEAAASAQEYVLGDERAGRGWIDYVQGITSVLRREGMVHAGVDLLIESDIPLGAGVSSSAALLVATARALTERFSLPLDDDRIATLAWRAENEFVGARVGVMDLMASSLGREGDALLIDTRNLGRRSLPLPPAIEIVVVDSGISHSHAGGEYNRRREECEQARRLLDVEYLCDLTLEDLDRLAALPDPVNRRARHAVTEQHRVLECVRALESDRYEALGRLIDESHQSLRDDYEVSTPEVDALVSALRRQPGVYGSRVTGGGFGGAVLALCRRGSGLDAARSAAVDYERETRRHATVLVPTHAPTIPPST